MIPASVLLNPESDSKGIIQMSAKNSIFVLTEQPPLLGTIREKGAADQIKSFLVARKKWARRQAKGAALPTLVQLMEESDIKSVCCKRGVFKKTGFSKKYH